MRWESFALVGLMTSLATLRQVMTLPRSADPLKLVNFDWMDLSADPCDDFYQVGKFTSIGEPSSARWLY